MEIGNIVKVEFGINDPLNRQGQVGQIIKIKEIDEDESEVLTKNDASLFLLLQRYDEIL